ncbi:MAG TPA: hypothetical protein PLQ76_04405, partial [bacterium]|nr:hypothetical protein [bacterium]
GIAATLLFSNYALSVFPKLNPFALNLAAVAYFCCLGVLLWGYLGVLNAISKSLEYILIKKNMLNTAVSNALAGIAEYILKNASAKSDDPAVSRSTLQRALDHFRKSDAIDISPSAGRRRGKTNFFLRILYRLIMRNELANVIDKQLRRFYSGGKPVSFSELRDSISKIGDTAGREIITGLYAEKMIVFSIVILLHLTLPFLIVLLFSH